MVESLVVGYGNSLRSDDGIGIRVAEIAASWNLPEVRSLARPQLTPELAADLASVDLVIFVDACRAVDSESVRLQALKPGDSIQIRTHFSDPRAILSLTGAIYGKFPQAWWLVVSGINFQLGDSLSAVAERGVALALERIGNLVSKTSREEDRCTKSV